MSPWSDDSMLTPPLQVSPMSVKFLCLPAYLESPPWKSNMYFNLTCPHWHLVLIPSSTSGPPRLQKRHHYLSVAHAKHLEFLSCLIFYTLHIRKSCQCHVQNRYQTRALLATLHHRLPNLSSRAPAITSEESPCFPS